MAAKRIKKEFRDMIRDPPELFTAQPVEDENLFEWVGTIYGPKESPYEGGKFYLKIMFPNDYPFKPPRIKFFTPMYHPNITKHGDISLEILCTHGWSPAITLSKVLLAVHSLLCTPDPETPLNVEVTKLYKTDCDMYFKLAKEWTDRYAS